MSRYTHVLFDLDGTLMLGDELLPGAADGPRAARAAGCVVGFLTNSPVHSRRQHAARLAAIGIDADPASIVTSGRALAGMGAAALPGAAALALGSDAFAQECRDHGLTVVAEPSEAQLVLLAGSREFGYHELTRAVRAVLVHGARAFGSNLDATYPGIGGPLPGAGSLVAALEYATRTSVPCAGKPGPAMFAEARAALGEGRYLVVGDRLDSDIAGAAGAGMDSALVLTGSTRNGDLGAWQGPQPTHVLPGAGSLASLV